MSLNGSIYNVRLLEIDLRQVTVDRDRRISWPQMEKDKPAPSIDGVLLLHDSTQPVKLEETSPLAGMFWSPGNSRLPPRVSPHMCHPSVYTRRG